MTERMLDSQPSPFDWTGFYFRWRDFYPRPQRARVWAKLAVTILALEHLPPVPPLEQKR